MYTTHTIGSLADLRENPGGAASGCSVGVSAGFGILGLGVEMDGGVLLPASRASLYAMRPTRDRVSLDGILTLTKSFDCIGAVARCPVDLMNMVKILKLTGPSSVTPDPDIGSLMNEPLKGLRLGFVDEKIWHDETNTLEEVVAASQKVGTALMIGGRFAAPLSLHVLVLEDVELTDHSEKNTGTPLKSWKTWG